MSVEENKALVRRYFEDAPYNPAARDEIFAEKVQWHALYHTTHPTFDSTPQIGELQQLGVLPATKEIIAKARERT